MFGNHIFKILVKCGISLTNLGQRTLNQIYREQIMAQGIQSEQRE